MKIEIVYTTKSKHMKTVADEMARWVKHMLNLLVILDMIIKSIY